MGKAASSFHGAGCAASSGAWTRCPSTWSEVKGLGQAALLFPPVQDEKKRKAYAPISRERGLRNGVARSRSYLGAATVERTGCIVAMNLIGGLESAQATSSVLWGRCDDLDGGVVVGNDMVIKHVCRIVPLPSAEHARALHCCRRGFVIRILVTMHVSLGCSWGVRTLLGPNIPRSCRCDAQHGSLSVGATPRTPAPHHGPSSYDLPQQPYGSPDVTGAHPRP